MSRQYWDRHAAADPLWAVLSFSEKSGGRWTLPEFMKTGEREIALLFHQLAELQITPRRRLALDFGCGVGRLTQALARRAAGALGADTSPVMIDLARQLNRYPGRVDYICTANTELATLPDHSFDLIYSNIVLQHVAPALAVAYLDEFFRLLEPSGVLVFQLPSHRDSPRDAEIKAMADAAYRGVIELAAPMPPSIAASSQCAIPLRVRNASTATWSQPDCGPLAVGNHWLDAAGALMLAQDDGRSPLLQVVPPDFEWPVLLTVRAPARPGTYAGEIDLVHEGVTWFADKGSRPLRFAIEVTPDSTTAAAGPHRPTIEEFAIPEYPGDVIPKPRSGGDAPVRAEFPMNGVPRDEVMSIIRSHGGRLVHLEEDRRAGPEWVSYRYFVVGR